MQVEKIPQEFMVALPLLQQIRAAGFEAYFVGGSVRDTILGLPIHDVDIATSAYPAEIKAIFERTVDTGIEHGTVMVLDHGEGYEITTFRTESGYQDFRRPDKVEFVRSLKEDLKRRDLTINALALAPDGTVIDMFSGLDDLENKTIRAVGDPTERFFEDALRMMRTVRFASQLDFKIEPQTLQAIKANAHLLEKIAVERIQVEWIKLLLGKNVVQGLDAFLETKLYKYCPQFATREQALRKIAKLPQLKLADELECWALLAYVFELTPKQVRSFLKAWKTSNEISTEVQNVLVILEQATSDLDPLVCYHAKERATKAASHLLDILQLPLTGAKLLQTYTALPIKDKAQLALNGKDLLQTLGLKPGPGLGKILNTLEQKVVLGELANDKTVLLAQAEKLSKELNLDANTSN